MIVANRLALPLSFPRRARSASPISTRHFTASCAVSWTRIHRQPHILAFKRVSSLFQPRTFQPRTSSLLPLFGGFVSFVINTFQPLFSVFVSADPLFSTPSKLFSPKQGGRGINHAPKILSCRYSRYLQCSQQNTNSLHFFARSTLCSQHVPASFHQNKGWVGVA